MQSSSFAPAHRGVSGVSNGMAATDMAAMGLACCSCCCILDTSERLASTSVRCASEWEIEGRSKQVGSLGHQLVVPVRATLSMHLPRSFCHLRLTIKEDFLIRCCPYLHHELILRRTQILLTRR